MDNINLEKCKMIFIYNALNNGWTVKKRDDLYIFTKKHKGEREIYKESYLNNFINDNFQLN